MDIRTRTAAAAVSLALIASGATAGPRSAPLEGEGEGLEIVANIEYQGGTDMEFATVKGRDYAFAGSAPGVGGAQAGALRVIDITKPPKPKVVATLNCSLYQSDIQLSHDEKTLIMAQDGSAAGPDACLMAGKTGFMTVDIQNPKKPKPLGVAEIPRGAHNVTAHPKKPYVYNSDSDLPNVGEIQIWSTENPKKPELVNTVRSLPHSPHDISFNKDGTRAVTAARTHFDIFDTSDPENPSLLFNPQGVTLGAQSTGGTQELGWFRPDGGSSWSSKLYKGPYIYSNDILRGFDVFEIITD